LLPDGSILLVNQSTTATLEAARKLTLSAGEVLLDLVPSEKASKFVVETTKGTVSGLGTQFSVRATGKGPGVGVHRGQAKVRLLTGAIAAGQQYVPGKHKPMPAPRLSHVLNWTRELVTGSEGSLVPASQQTGGALIAVDPDGQEAKLSLRK